MPEVLSCTTYDGHSWSRPDTIEGRLTGYPPALAAFPGTVADQHLYCAFRNAGGHFAWTRTNGEDGFTWENTQAITASAPDSGPALTTYTPTGHKDDDRLYAFYAKGNALEWLISQDGESFSDPQPLKLFTASEFTEQSAPTAAVYNEKLYLASSLTIEREDTLAVAAFDGTRWTVLPDTDSYKGTNPALAVFQDELFCIREAAQDGKLAFTSYSDESWATDQTITSPTGTAENPALALFEEDLMVCVFNAGGHKGQDALYATTTSNGTTWTTPQPLRQDPTEAIGEPALAKFTTEFVCVSHAR
ncbi:hypothetical protein [Streptomyces sp. NPDC002403]